MLKHIKVFYYPEEGQGIGPVSEISDKDILNRDDSDDEISDGEGSSEEEDEEKEEDEVSDSEGSDGSEDEDEVDKEEDDDADADDSDNDEEESPDEEEAREEKVDASNLTKAVKKLAPDLFKKVPGLREALERDKEFGEVFPTIEDAKDAARNANLLFAMYGDISSGDVTKTGNFLKAIKNTNEEAFEDFSHTILESIGKLNPQLYGEVMLKPMKKALMSMYNDAVKSGNKNLAAVAIHAHNYWFETQDINAPLEERKKATKTKEQEEWEKEKQEFENTRVGEFRAGITEVVNHSMKLSISKELEGIKMDDYQKRNIIKDIFTGVDELIGQDKRYLSGINSLFEQAKSSKYNADWKSRIIRAYLQRARQALPSIRNKVLREAGIKVKDSPKAESRRLVPAGLGGNKSEEKIDFSRVDRTRTTDMDILNGRPKYVKK